MPFPPGDMWFQFSVEEVIHFFAHLIYVCRAFRNEIILFKLFIYCRVVSATITSEVFFNRTCFAFWTLRQNLYSIVVRAVVSLRKHHLRACLKIAVAERSYIYFVCSSDLEFLVGEESSQIVVEPILFRRSHY